mmetsp:Transcript_122732/g.217356  ORF Transcript_122732/g.217356 Transcript_122732/m.217356 type:complete len:138 (-) Transcript_122732:87-500(-)
MLKDMSTVGFLWRMVAIVLLVPAKEVPIANGTAGRILAPRELAQAMAATAIPYTVTDPIFELQQIRTLAEAITEHAEIFEPDRLSRPGSTTSAAAAVAAPASPAAAPLAPPREPARQHQHQHLYQHQQQYQHQHLSH